MKKSDFITMTVTVILFIATMFQTELRDTVINILTHWDLICFWLAILLLIFTIAKISLRYELKQMLKSELKDIYEASNRTNEFYEFWKNNYKIDHLFIRDISLNIDSNNPKTIEKIYRFTKKHSIQWEEWRKYGMDEEIIQKLQQQYHIDNLKKSDDDLGTS
jgi:hypothetical protein